LNNIKTVNILTPVVQLQQLPCLWRSDGSGGKNTGGMAAWCPIGGAVCKDESGEVVGAEFFRVRFKKGEFGIHTEPRNSIPPIENLASLIAGRLWLFNDGARLASFRGEMFASDLDARDVVEATNSMRSKSPLNNEILKEIGWSCMSSKPMVTGWECQHRPRDLNKLADSLASINSTRVDKRLGRELSIECVDLWQVKKVITCFVLSVCIFCLAFVTRKRSYVVQ
jgi:hypothetical protein